MILSTLTPPVYKHVYHIIGCPKKQPLFLEISSSSPSILRSWLYFAVRSERQGAPVLICPALTATARSAMKLSSVSPDLWRSQSRSRPFAVSMAARLSLKVPIWFTFTRMAFGSDRIPFKSRASIGDKQIVSHKLDPVPQGPGKELPSLPILLVWRPSSMEHMGKPSDRLRKYSTISSADLETGIPVMELSPGKS